QGFAQNTHSTRIDLRPTAAPTAIRALRDRKLQPAAAAQLGDQVAAGRVRIGVVHTLQRRGAPVFQALRELVMLLIEERPVQPASVAHQSPWNTGFCFATKAS